MEDVSMNRRPWKRLAALRAARRRGTEFPSPPPEAPLEPIPPLEPPDDDREFVIAWFSGIRARPEAA
jgi:hypothetical protein